MLPIDKNSNDKFYRYKMPEIIVSREGKRTVLANLDQVAKSLHRDPFQIMKFIGMSLGCIPTIDGTKCILNGSFDSDRVQAMIYEYIDIFVLCKECGNPETKFQCLEGRLERKCNSCGAEFAQSAHKLNSFIIKTIDKSINEDCNYKGAEESLFEMSGDSQANIAVNDEGSINRADTADRSSAVDGDRAGAVSGGSINRDDDTENGDSVNRADAVALEALFSDFVKASELENHKDLIRRSSRDEVLRKIEDMLENQGKDGKIGGYLEKLCEFGFECDEIEAYFNTNRENHKRSALIKKEAKYFIENYED